MFHKAQNTPKETTADKETQGSKNMEQDNTQNSSESTAQNTVDIPKAGSASAYAPRPAQSKPGQFPGTPEPQTSTPMTHATPANGRRLVIGTGISMSGEIEACDHLIVEGTVEAALKGASVLDVAETGTFLGKVEIDEATIAGRFDGEITVTGRLTVKSSGEIKGSIRYGELAVDAGAQLSGTLKPYDASEKTETKPAKSSTKASKASGSKKQAANTGTELPFADSKAAAAE